MTQQVRPTINPVPTYPQIIIALNYLDTNRYHWIIYIPDPDNNNGRKLHATTDFADWSFDASQYSLITDQGVCAAAIIGELKPTKGFTLDKLIEILKLIPMSEVPDVDKNKEPKFTCRVWIKEAVRRMHDISFIDCPDVDALEEEIKEYGSVACEAIDNDVFIEANLVVAKCSK